MSKDNKIFSLGKIEFNIESEKKETKTSFAKKYAHLPKSIDLGKLYEDIKKSK